VLRCRAFVFVGLLLSTLAMFASADGRSRFVKSVFGDAEPELKTLWLSAEIKAVLKTEFDYTLNRVRIRYWQLNDRSMWVLDEVGKEQPITMAVVVDAQKIFAIDVLEYRESRGGEIQYPFFHDQFHGATLIDKRGKKRLSQRVDGITGATLSVRAMKKVARVALFLHARVNPDITQ